MIELKSFDLEITGSEAGGYVVQATGPDGERDAAPLDPALLDGFASDLEAIQAGQLDGGDLERVGAALYLALFPTATKNVYIAAQARLRDNEGLRLRLHLPPELAGLPWELLYEPPSFLCLDPTRPVVRFLNMPNPPKALAVEPPLRLLHLAAAPVDQPRLDVVGEAQRLDAALGDLVGRGKLQILPRPPGTQAGLRDGLRQRPHILHFSGHGGFGEERGYLFFEGRDGHSDPVDSDMLAQLLRGPWVRLALLNACETAQAATGDAFGSIAAALVQTRLPAVIAHQYVMPDSSAQAFAAEFYAALADGYPVDAAVTEGRRAVLSELGGAWRERIDWATPVLFMQARDGRILKLAGPTAARGQPPPVDTLDALLDELRNRVRDQAPPALRDEAMAKMAMLRGAATEKRPNLKLIESIWHWSQAEIPALSGAVLSAILGLEEPLRERGDDAWWEFQERFGDG